VYQLTPSRFGISDDGNERYNLLGILHVGKTTDPSISKDSASITTILDHLKKTYTGRIGFEFSHIPSASERRWFATLVESYDKKQFSKQEKLRISSLLTKSEV
jgi:probable 2-oxoglutarate dehydrogenase E1 component DHKTD1